jgi:hypothetical protein
MCLIALEDVILSEKIDKKMRYNFLSNSSVFLGLPDLVSIGIEDTGFR